MPEMAAHVHTPDREHRALALEWCACGYERKDGRWRAPRTTEGKIRRMRWTGGR